MTSGSTGQSSTTTAPASSSSALKTGGEVSTIAQGQTIEGVQNVITYQSIKQALTLIGAFMSACYTVIDAFEKRIKALEDA